MVLHAHIIITQAVIFDTFLKKKKQKSKKGKIDQTGTQANLNPFLAELQTPLVKPDYHSIVRFKLIHEGIHKN